VRSAARVEPLALARRLAFGSELDERHVDDGAVAPCSVRDRHDLGLSHDVPSRGRATKENEDLVEGRFFTDELVERSSHVAVLVRSGGQGCQPLEPPRDLA
jgi:hypothetical protein